MIGKIKNTPEITPAKIKRFDGKFEGEITDICTNCRFDVELIDGTKFEYKSYSETSVNMVSTSTSFLNQHLSYLADVNDISKLNYIFDAKKFNKIDDIKKQFQKMYQGKLDDVFDVIWDNTNLKNGLLGNRNYNVAKSYFTELVQGAENNKLYNFIKVE